jgi:hypothetical protein
MPRGRKREMKETLLTYRGEKLDNDAAKEVAGYVREMGYKALIMGDFNGGSWIESDAPLNEVTNAIKKWGFYRDQVERGRHTQRYMDAGMPRPPGHAPSRTRHSSALVSAEFQRYFERVSRNMGLMLAAIEQNDIGEARGLARDTQEAAKQFHDFLREK